MLVWLAKYFKNMKLKKGDKVRIMVGKDAGKEGQIEKVFLTENTVLLPNLNQYKRHLKPRKEGEKGGIVDVNRPISAAKVSLVCPKCKSVTRVGFKMIKDKKVRICRKCQEEV